jgi:hypothetical protein
MCEKTYEKVENEPVNEQGQGGKNNPSGQDPASDTRGARATGAETQMSMAQAKAESVLQIIDNCGWQGEEFDIHDARWCLRILAEAIVDL